MPTQNSNELVGERNIRGLHGNGKKIQLKRGKKKNSNELNFLS